jgi:hypothetical protein
MPSIGGVSTTSTGRVAQHATRAAQSRSGEGTNRLAGTATVSTGRVSQSVKRATGTKGRLPVKLGGVASQIRQHVGASGKYGL